MSYTVLVVDDHPATVELIKEALEGPRIGVRTAANGAECLLAVSRERPDLIILDVLMPVMDGFQTLEVLRQSSGSKGIPVIMLTARTSDADVLYGWRLGVSSYLTKPFVIQELVLLVTRVIEGELRPSAADEVGGTTAASLIRPREQAE